MLREDSSSTMFTAAHLHTFEQKYSQLQESSRENDGLVGNRPTNNSQGRSTPERPGKKQGLPSTHGRSQAKVEDLHIHPRLPDWWTVKSNDTQLLHSLDTTEDVRYNEDKRAWSQQAAVLQQKLNLLEKSCSLPPTDSRCRNVLLKRDVNMLKPIGYPCSWIIQNLLPVLPLKAESFY